MFKIITMGWYRIGCAVIATTPDNFILLLNGGYFYLKHFFCLVVDQADKLLIAPPGKEFTKVLYDFHYNLFGGDISPPGRRNWRLISHAEGSLFVFSATAGVGYSQLDETMRTAFLTLKVDSRERGLFFASHRLRVVRSHERYSTLVEELNKVKFCRVLVFVNACRSAHMLNERLASDGWVCGIVTGEMSLKQRLSAIRSFRDGLTLVMVATDIVGRGIDIPNIKLVVNFNVPDSIDTYVHRVGRTGRAGCGGSAVCFLTNHDKRFSMLLESFFEKMSLSIPPCVHKCLYYRVR
jgi:ATP-dependent RNA helicase DDX23/PRP28